MFTARKVFIVTSYFNFLYSSLLHFWPLAISTTAEAFVSIRRIQDFLLLPENKNAALLKQLNVLANDFKNNIELKSLLGQSEAINEKTKAKRYLSEDGSYVQRRNCINTVDSSKGIVFKNATAKWLRGKEESNTGKCYSKRNTFLRLNIILNSLIQICKY